MTSRRAEIGPFPDRLDRIARTAYGAESGGTVEALLAANPAIVDAPAGVDAGTVLDVPERIVEEAATVTRPWI